MRYVFRVVAILVLIPLMCCLRSARAPILQVTTEAEYSVYSTIISSMFAGNKVTFDTQAKVKMIIIRDRTVLTGFEADEFPELAKSLKEQLPILLPDTLNDFLAKNKEPKQLQRLFKLNNNYTLVEHQEIEGFFRKNGKDWNGFYQKYPDSGGFVSLSSVGFNSAVNQAIVFVAHGCGGLCGSGHFALLTKGETGWKVETRFMAWIS